MHYPLLYYTVSRKELRPSEMPANIPLLLSAASFTTDRKNGSVHLLPPRLPSGTMLLGADCGGFVATTRWNATYRFRPLHYIQWLSTWRPQWAATFDYCCVDAQDTPHGRRLIYPGAAIVKQRQQQTTDMAEHFWVRARLVPWTWTPTIQGFTPDEFETHAHQLAHLIRKMYSYYADLASTEEDGEENAFRVGIGSLCGRARLPVLLEVIARVQQVIGADIPLHLWGIKLRMLQAAVLLRGVISVDTGAWNGLWGKEHERRRASGLTEIEYSWRISQKRYAQRIASASHRPRQGALNFLPDSLYPWHRVMFHHHAINDAIADGDGSEDTLIQHDLARPDHTEKAE